MTTRLFQIATLLACTVFSAPALADPPARVGRVSYLQGQVSISGEVGDEASPAQLNWPVTSHHRINTGRDARTEIRVGSASVLLDADSSIEVSELDDDTLRLRLDHGSANVRIRNAELLPGFELATPNARVRLREPGRLRVDAERVRGGTAVNVFDGVALVEDRGAQLIVRTGKRVEIRDDDVRTGPATRDGFDDWAQLRDQDEHSTSARYVTSEMTGYEELDRHGVWHDDAEYGPLWMPTVVTRAWAPYRDGSWTWISPWGWTWVDNAPWGYAPFHYGRWVYVRQRWAWVPGRHVSRPVWAPALVGWVGGAHWNVRFGAHRSLPAQGWFPLSPREVFVPGYRIPQRHLQHINRDARHGGRHDARRHEHHRDGLTVVPREQFWRRGPVAVPNAPRAIVSPPSLQGAASAAPSAPPRLGHDREGRGRDRFDRDRFDRDPARHNRQQRPEPAGLPAPTQQVPLANPAQPALPGGTVTHSPFPRRDGRPDFDDRDQWRRRASAGAAPAPATIQPVRPAGIMPPSAAPQPMPQAIVQPPAAEPQRGRWFRNDAGRPMREPEAGQQMPAQQPRQLVQPPVFHQQSAPAPVPAPVAETIRQVVPPVVQHAAPPTAAASLPAAAPRNHPGSDRKNRPEAER